MSWKSSFALTLLLTACAPKPAASPSGPAAPPAPTPADAAAFVEGAERELAELSEVENRTGWVYENFITDDTEWLIERVGAQGVEARVRLAKEAARFQGLELPADTKRKLELLRLSLVLPAPSRDGAAQDLSAIGTSLSSRYSTGAIDYGGRQVKLDELETLMGEVRDPKKLQEMWTEWHDVAKPMGPEYAKLVALANDGAKELGYANVGELWLSKYDMPAADMEAEVQRLWTQMQPFYEQLHCYVRGELSQEYGASVQPATGPIRADLLGNMWAQEWQTLYPIVAPKGGASYDLTNLLVKQKYTPVKLVETGERFYTSLGLPELPDTFWDRSLLTRPQDREVVCHASAWDLDNADDIRIKECIQINAEHFQTVHHELGHNYYQRAYKAQPFLYKDGANDGFHEAIGDFVALNTTPEYLVKIGLLTGKQVPPASADTGLLLSKALDKLAFLPFAISVDTWRWKVFRGEVSPEQYNQAWWDLRKQYQGIQPPAPRPADAFDPGAKYHVANSVPYLRYFLAAVLQFQFYEAACQQASWQGPLHRCTIYDNKDVGAKFARMLEMGSSQPWPDALEAFTGSRTMDAGSMVRYFEPLSAWLKEQNKGRTCGW